MPLPDPKPARFQDLPRQWLPSTLPFAEAMPDDFKAAVARMVEQGHPPDVAGRKLSAMRRRMKTADPIVQPTVPSGIAPPAPPLPDIRPEDIPVFRGIKGRYLRTVLSQEEHAVYVEKWVEIMQAHHEDFTDPFDLMDVGSICMETVVQLRLLRHQATKPKQYSPAEYAASVRRLDKARENLASRRSDRLGRNSKSLNVAVLVSQMGSPEAAMHRHKVQVIAQGEEETFLLGSPSQETTREHRGAGRELEERGGADQGDGQA